MALKPNSTFLLDALYCSEEHLEDQEEERSMDDAVYQFQLLEESTTYNNYKQNPSPWSLLEQDLAWEEHELSSLLSRERENPLLVTLRSDPSLAEPRREAVAWMLKTVAHYSFSALTATLAVDYLDSFLVGFQLQSDNPWMAHLAAVACLSLAAKVEETQVPLLLDLQVEESKFLFEAKTIKRMELLVLSTLAWKMSPVTPISFLDYIIRRLGLKDHLCLEFLRKCETIIISLLADSRFMTFLPSIVATATMLHVVDSIEPCLQAQYQDQLLGILGIDKEKAEDCLKLILELAYSNQSKKRKFVGLSGSVPSSPNGVIDVSFSSDSSNDSWAVGSSSVSSSPEPLSKKNRAQTTTSRTETTNSDFLSIIPR